MNCWGKWELSEDDSVIGERPDCGEETIDGYARYGCDYSPIVCETCKSSPCAGRC